MSMTVSQLIARLEEFNPDNAVFVTICPIDGEAQEIKDVFASNLGVMIEVTEEE